METRRIVRDFTGWFVQYFVALPSISRGSIVPFAWQDATALGIYVEPFTREIPRRRLDFMDSPWKEFRRERERARTKTRLITRISCVSPIQRREIVDDDPRSSDHRLVIGDGLVFAARFCRCAEAISGDCPAIIESIRISILRK